MFWRELMKYENTVCEDDRGNSIGICSMKPRKGYDVTHCLNAESARNAISQDKFDLALLVSRCRWKRIWNIASREKIYPCYFSYSQDDEGKRSWALWYGSWWLYYKTFQARELYPYKNCNEDQRQKSHPKETLARVLGGPKTDPKGKRWCKNGENNSDFAGISSPFRYLPTNPGRFWPDGSGKPMGFCRWILSTITLDFDLYVKRLERKRKWGMTQIISD